MIPDDEGSPRPLALPLPRADDGFDAKAAAAATGFSSFSLCTKEEKERKENKPRDKYRIFPDYGFHYRLNMLHRVAHFYMEKST